MEGVSDRRTAAGPALAPISVVIPVFNDPDMLTRCLTALASSTCRPLETIVVDDGSTERIRPICEAFGVTSIRVSDGPRGPAYARNAGAAAASGKILVFIDADVLIRTDTLQRFAETFERNADASAVFGSYDDAPATPDFVSQFKNLLHHFVHQQANTESETFWSGCGAVRRDVFLAAGGFDATRYPRPSIEDIELGYRLRAAGHRILLNKAIQVKHLKRWTLRGLVHTDVFDRGAPWTELILERGRLPNDLNLHIMQRLSAMLAYSMLLYGLAALIVIALSRLSFPVVAPLTAGAGLLVVLNYRLYVFFARQRGLTFAAAALPMHFFYYAYALVGLGFGGMAFLTNSRRSRMPAGAA
jgi:glycosyltransferase involved in cell wall biosynthesis